MSRMGSLGEPVGWGPADTEPTRAGPAAGPGVGVGGGVGEGGWAVEGHRGITCFSGCHLRQNHWGSSDTCRFLGPRNSGSLSVHPGDAHLNKS